MRSMVKMQIFTLSLAEDSFAMFDQWVHPERICAVCKIVVAKRPLDKAAIKKAHPMAFNERIEAYRQKFSTEFIEMPVEVMDISSSYIRKCLQAGEMETILSMLPDAVLSYIAEHQLYQADYPLSLIDTLQKKVIGS